jgi:hypothetical protein
MDFTSLDQLSKYLNTSAGQSTVLSNGMTIEKMLKQEANRLKTCIEKRLDEYYASYDPVMYMRTENLRYSMSVDDFVSIDISSGTASITIDFDKYAIAAHSVFGDDSSNYNKVELINNGWQVKDSVWFADVEHFGYQEGSHFIENGIADFNQSNPYNLKIEVKGMFNS